MMMIRSFRRSLFAPSHFSTQAVAVEKVAQTPAASSSTFTSNTAVKDSTSAGRRDTLGRRLLSLVYSKRSAVIAINKWKEEGHTVRKYELNRIVRELRKLKRYKHALEICEWMTVQQDIKLQQGDYAVHLDLVAKVRGLSSADKFFEDLPEQMRGQATCTSLLHVYVRNNLSVKAEALMEKMSECGFLKYPLPYNHMLSLYIRNGQLEKFPQIIQELKKNTSPDIVTFNLWLTVCASQNNVETAEKVLLELNKAKVDPDWVTYSTLSNLYIKSALPEKAAPTLKEMEKKVTRKTRGAYSSLLSLHASMGNKDEVVRIWKKLKSCYHKMNDAEYTCIISSFLKLGDLSEAENIYSEWESISRTGDTRISNLLLAAYINQDQMQSAENFYHRLLEKGIKPSYTTLELLIWGNLKMKQTDKVLDYFKKAVVSVDKWSPDEKLVRELFKNLEEQGHIEGAEQLLVIIRNSGYINTEIYNSLLRTYAKAGQMPLIVAERMKKDNVELNGETQRLIELTSKMCVSDSSSILS